MRQSDSVRLVLGLVAVFEKRLHVVAGVFVILISSMTVLKAEVAQADTMLPLDDTPEPTRSASNSGARHPGLWRCRALQLASSPNLNRSDKLPEMCMWRISALVRLLRIFVLNIC